jgi:tRNA(Ile)-lysidine synthase
VAFSGGSDSLALLVVACEYGHRSGRPVLAATVDHGLQPDSAAWTRSAGETAERLGARWQPLVWTGSKPSTGLPAAARRARHILLADFARQSGARVVLMGHTADDLAESALMRRTDTPGLPDPREWAPSPVWPEGRGVFLLRPLLGERRDDLRQRLVALGLRWLEDPANLDPRFARARARQTLRQTPAPALGQSPQPTARLLDARMAECARTVRFHAAGHAVMPRSLIHPATGEMLAPLLGAAIACVGGGATGPRGNVLNRLVERLAAPGNVQTQLAGVHVSAGPDEIILARDAGETRRRARAAVAGIDLSGVFDNRFAVPAGVAVEMAAGSIARLPAPDRARLRLLPAVVRPSVPVVRGPSGQLLLPAPLGEGPAVEALAPARFAAACGLVACEADIG